MSSSITVGLPRPKNEDDLHDLPTITNRLHKLGIGTAFENMGLSSAKFGLSNEIIDNVLSDLGAGSMLTKASNRMNVCPLMR